MSSKQNVTVSVRGLGKAYTIARNGDNATSAAEAIARRMKNPLRRRQTDTFWALKDVSFDLNRGDVVGVIGRNGAGKSTLLKVLSRITEPTTGQAILHGRVGSLLEVGTGFHPELTGRENIYLNGAILGMSKREIDNQFDAIVDFSGTERFLETPVKRYSSGMYVRLAFAVAAHLNPEILIVDEVLAVGDSEFQKKCLGKMKDVANSGRTILFVSHTMASVLELCNRCVYLKDGAVFADGPAGEVVDKYIRSGELNQAERHWAPDDAPGDATMRLLSVRVLGPDGLPNAELTLSDSVTLEMNFEMLQPGLEIAPVFHVFNSQSVCLFSNAKSDDDSWARRKYGKGRYVARCTIPALILNDGTYDVHAIIVRELSNIVIYEKQTVSFEIHEDGTGRGGYTGPMMGVLRQHFPWTIE